MYRVIFFGKMNPSLKRQLIKIFSQMVDDLKNVNEIELFFEDFFENDEYEKYVRRLATIYWLKKGRDKENIKRNLGSSEKEIKEAQISLQKEGIKVALKKIEAEEWANQWVKRIKKFKK